MPVDPLRRTRTPNLDIIKVIRSRRLCQKTVSEVVIPVPEALENDPLFEAAGEQVIIQQVMEGKKFEGMDAGEYMIQICKKLAEKRVFGPRLMSQTTVAGLNHSNYANLPIEGLLYIEEVCRRIIGDRFKDEDDFYDNFREAMRKVAARCRRLKHSMKQRQKRQEEETELLRKRCLSLSPIQVNPPSEPTPSPSTTSLVDDIAVQLIANGLFLPNIVAPVVPNLTQPIPNVFGDSAPFHLLANGLIQLNIATPAVPSEPTANPSSECPNNLPLSLEASNDLLLLLNQFMARPSASNSFQVEPATQAI